MSDYRDDAISKLQGKIYADEQGGKISMRPLDEKEMEVLIKKLERDAHELWLRLKRENIIYADDYHYITSRVITNHLGLIEDALKNIGHNFELDYAELYEKYFAIIDKNSKKDFKVLMMEHYDK